MTTFTAEDPKDPDAILEYKFDWKAKTNLSGNTDWLDSSETISTFAIVATSGITVDSSSKTDTDTSVTVWLSGGTDGITYEIACKVTTATRTDERTFSLKVEER